MAEIGELLRETRMRARIDISELEAQTKIRAKYLRALENEEWDLLPGPTFVKSFLRTYADALGLDGKLLVDEYKVRYENPRELDLQPIRPPRASEQRRRAAESSNRSRTLILVAVLVAGLAAALWVLGSTGGGRHATQRRPAAGTPTIATVPRVGAPARPPARPVSLQIRTVGPVVTCLVTGAGRKLINAQQLPAGTTTTTYRASRLLLSFNTGPVTLVIDGTNRAVPSAPNGIGYSITRAYGRKVLPRSQWPRCG